ncbi:MAG: transporter substrate-binding domain-containing protein [Lachnospiraceae bacterium]|nr:transporter substrate-binding domain-containing protein [Lachnospiraceae bacterium]
MLNKKINKLITTVLGAALIGASLTGCGKVSNTTNIEATTVSVESASNSESGSVGNEVAEVTNEVEVRKIYAVTGASPRPFTYYGDDDQVIGQNIELVEAVFEKLPQYELVWEVTDFPSIFAGLDSDKYQLGVNNFAKNPEREEKYYFTDPIFSNAYIVVANKDVELPDSLSVEDLGGLKFVGQAAVNVTTLIENYNDTDPEKPVEINYTEEDLNIQLNDIQSGKYDFTIIDKPMYFGYYQPEFGYDLHAIALAGYGVGEGMDSYLIVSRTEENKQLVEDINKALREVIEEGKSKEINLKYFGDDYSPSYE